MAGVTDGTNLGGHGSNAVVRTKESLARDIASLSASGTSNRPAALPPSAADTDESSLRATADREPGNFDANHRLGKLLVASGKASQALAYLERASQLKPGELRKCLPAGTGLCRRRSIPAGAHKCAGLADGTGECRARPAQKNQAQKDQAELHHLLGDIEEKSGNPLEAVREYQRAAELDPSEPYFFDWGSELLLHRAVEPAIEVFNKGNRLFPHSARMLVALGVAWYSNGSYDQAAQRLCEASDLNPGDPKAYLFLGKIQSVETNAIRMFDRAAGAFCEAAA